jgi:hypothetical protein
MKETYCILGGTFFISSIIMAIMKTDTDIFIKFNQLLTEKQQKQYKKIIKERTCIYIFGMLLGLMVGFYFLYLNPDDEYRICKFLCYVYVIKFGFYYFVPKSPLMLYSLTTKEQTDQWANIYTTMKQRWQMSIILGFLSYICLGLFIN